MKNCFKTSRVRTALAYSFSDNSAVDFMNDGPRIDFFYYLIL